MNVSGRRRFPTPLVRQSWRRARLRLAAIRIATFPSFARLPDRLVVAPTDLRAADPFIADEIAEGRFPLAGRLLDTGGASPFAVDLPSRDFAARLHGFSWLRHVRATRSDYRFATARTLTDEWIELHGSRITGIAWEPEVLAQRIVAWLSHSTVLLKNADIRFYRRFLKSLALQVRYLTRTAHLAPDGDVRLKVRIALAVASVSIPTSQRLMRRASAALDKELERQILPDGGHFSRNPRIGLELLLELLPLRQTYVNLGLDPPARLIPTIDRMYPALRFFRHQSGELALFNGATTTLANELMSVLRYDETGGRPFKALPHMRYQRLAVRDTVLIVDTGMPASPELSMTAHAGCLSFEMSSGKQRFIMNSGAPRFAGNHYRQLARATAAHSTLTLNDTSSSRVSRDETEGPVFSDGISEVKVTRHASEEGNDGVTASHDGYLVPFGVLHERTIQVNSGGTMIRGKDRLMQADGKDPPATADLKAVIRFHIHPQVDIREIDEHEVHLVGKDGDTWSLSTLDAEITIEEDVFFADPSGIRASKQVELAFDAAQMPEVQWVLTHRSSAGR